MDNAETMQTDSAAEQDGAVLEIDISPVRNAPRLSQYFGFWAHEPRRFEAAAEVVRRTDLAAHMLAFEGPSSKPGAYGLVDGVAVIDVAGAMTKYGGSLADMEHGTLGVREALRRAAANEAVKAIALRIDSPGGTVDGTADLGEEVARAAGKKPLAAYIEDLGASAAYWVASQAPKLYSNATAQVGSIGVYARIEDWSRLYEEAGVTVHIVRSGFMKGAGSLGTAVTEEQMAEWQREIESVHALFVGAVARGRGLDEETVKGLADGRVFIAGEAQRLGLIDGVKSFEQVLEELRGPRPAANHERGQRMSTEATTAVEPRAATLNELKAACAGADNDFIVAQMEANATVAQAQGAWIAELNRRQATAAKMAEDAKAEAAEAKAALEAKKPGGQPIGTGAAKVEAASSPDAIEAWESAIAEQIRAGKSKPAAIRSVVAEQPDLHKAYLEEHNRRNGR